jgi:CHAT domain-containing protein/tetratricopeptide (TPR) repeat protein
MTVERRPLAASQPSSDRPSRAPSEFCRLTFRVRFLTILSCAALALAADAYVLVHGVAVASQESPVATIDQLFAEVGTRLNAADFHGARDIAEQIIARAQQSEGPDSLSEARAHYFYALAAFMQRDFAATDRATERARTIYSLNLQLGRLRNVDVPLFVQTFELFAVSLNFQGRFNEAATVHETLVKNYEAVQGPERWRLLEARAKLASDLQFAGRYQEGSKELARAIAEWHHLREDNAEIPQYVLQSFGSQLLKFGDMSEAHAVLDRAVLVDEKVAGPDTPDKGRRLVLLGRILRERSDFSPAIDTLQRGADILRRTLGEQHPEVVSAIFHVGKTFLMATAVFANNPTGAHKIADTARAILLNATRLYLALPENARTGLDFTTIEFNVSLAIAEVLAGNSIAARDLIQPLLDPLQKDVDGPIGYFNGELARDFLIISAFLLTERDFSRAERFADFARRGLETLGPDHLLMPRALLLLGLARASQGDEAEGLSLVLRSVEVADRSVDRLLAGLSGRQRLEALRLLDHVDLVFNLPPQSVDSKLAYRVALGRKNAVFRLAVDERPPGDSDPHVAALYRDYNEVRRELARMARASGSGDGPTKAAVEPLVHRSEEFERELGRSSDRFRHARAAARADYGAVCAALGPHTALIEYVAFARFAPQPAEYTAFVLRGEQCDRGPLRFDLGPIEPINDALKELRLALKVGLRGFQPMPSVQDSAQHLAALILPADLRQSLKGITRLAIAPDGELATTPFNLLPGDNSAEFMIETYAISYVPSGRDLLRNERAFTLRGSAPSVLALGNPEFGTAAPENRGMCVKLYDPLPGSEQEVRAVVSRFKAQQGASTELMGSEASKARVLREMEGKRILHFATHAFVGNENCRATDPADESTPSTALDAQLTAPLAGAGLALRGANTGSADGALTALEITTLNLDQADLVVLSGCETGLGTINPGQELVGLRWAFMEAGAKSVVASLWEIPDEATVALVTNFYDELVRTTYQPVTAIREAQLARLRDDRAHGRYRPWEWGTFTISVSYSEPE